MHSNAQEIEANGAAIADLLTELSMQIDNVRRRLDLTSKNSQTSDVVFVDDLAHCMECSWARLEAAGIQLTPDLLAQCSRLLQASLKVLQQVERLQAQNDHTAADS